MYVCVGVWFVGTKWTWVIREQESESKSERARESEIIFLFFYFFDNQANIYRIMAFCRGSTSRSKKAEYTATAEQAAGDIYLYIHTGVYVHTYIYVHTHLWRKTVYVNVYVYIYENGRVHSNRRTGNRGCISIYMYVYMFIYTYMYMNLYIQICTRTYIWICIYKYEQGPIYSNHQTSNRAHIYSYTCMYIHSYIYLCIYLKMVQYTATTEQATGHSYLHTCTYVCLCTYIYIYVHMCKRPNTQQPENKQHVKSVIWLFHMWYGAFINVHVHS